MGGFGSRPFHVFVLLCIRKDYGPRVPGVFGRAVVVEKNMLWYNTFMGKQRRSKEFKNNSQVIDMEEARRQRLEKRRAEKAKEEEKARYAASQKTRGKMAIRRSRNRRRLMIGIVVVCVIIAVGASVINVISLKKEQHDIMKQAEELKLEKQQLEKELANINDTENLEEQARNQLRLIKPGELLYMFPEEITESRTNQQNTQEE